jgi:uncharacterized protein (DUF1501 family)
MYASRRRFLKTTFGASALLSMGLEVPGFLTRTALAADSAAAKDRVLIVVQLSGGNDGLNTVIPYADDGYRRNRVVLRIPQEQVLKVDDYIGLHPQMAGFEKLLQEQHLSIVQGVGYPNPDRSHFRSMDIWHSAQPDFAKPQDGWLGRSLAKIGRQQGGDVPALHLGPQELPLALMSQERPVPSVDSLESFQLRTAGGALATPALSQLASTPRPENPLLSFVQRSALTAYASSQQVREALKDQRSAVSYPAFGLARKLRSIAHLIDAGLATRIYYVSLDGFDTHANQAQAHGGLLGELSSSLAAFIEDLRQRGHLDRVLVMSFSEFGRRVKENASQGTDHGAAAPLFLMGSRMKPGTFGKHPSLSDLDAEGDLKHHTDFRRVYATLLDRWLACSSRDILGSDFEPLPLL